MYLSGHLTLLLYSIGVPESRLYTFGRSSAPRTVLVAKKWGDDDATEALVEVANWVRNERGLTVLLDPNDPDGSRKPWFESHRRYSVVQQRMFQAVWYDTLVSVAAQRDRGPLSKFRCLGCRKKCVEGDGGEVDSHSRVVVSR